MKISKLAAALTLGFVAAAGTLVPTQAEAADLPIPTCLPAGVPNPLNLPTCLPSAPPAPGVPTLPTPAPPTLPNGLPAIPGVTCANDGTPNPFNLPSCSVVSAPGGTTQQSGVSGYVQISGKPRVGKKLHADLSAYSAPGYTISYQWLRNGKAITVKKNHKKRPATKPSYKLVGKDRGKQIVLLVTASKSGSSNAVNYAVAPKIKKAKRS